MSENTLFRKVVDSDAFRVVQGVATGGASELLRRGAYAGYAKAKAPQKARRAQEDLEFQRREELNAQSAARASARKRAETAGQRAGRGSTRSQFTSDLGMGTASSGSGRGRLFGN